MVVTDKNEMVVTDKGFLLVPVDRPYWIFRGRIGSKKVRPIRRDLRYFRHKIGEYHVSMCFSVSALVVCRSLV